MKIVRDCKKYNVQSVAYEGAIVNVNGTSITDYGTLWATTGNPLYAQGGYSVFVDGDELYFDTFEKAYEFATTKQKDTIRL